LASAAPNPDNFDLTNAGRHDPQLGATAFAHLIGVTDARFEFCGWRRSEWQPLRDQATALAPRIFAKAGLPQDEIEKQIELGRIQIENSSAKFPKAGQCVARAGTPIEQRVIRSMRAVLNWGRTYLTS
jgi:hypothetical protein